MRGKASWGPRVFAGVVLALLLASSGPSATGEDPRGAEVRLGLTRADRMDLQRALTARGFEVGPIDGVFGRRTRGAIGNWQQATGLAVTGYLEASTLGRLITRAAPSGNAKRARLRKANYAARIAAAEGLESPRQRSTALLAIVLEQVAAGDLEEARAGVPRIEDRRKRDRAFERVREAERRAARESGSREPRPRPGTFAVEGP